MINVVAYNGYHFSMLLPTTQKSALIPIHVCFSALLPTTPIIFPRFGPQCGKMIGVVAYIAEKLSMLLITMRKNVGILISPRIRNHMGIQTTVGFQSGA
jgi:hypothetical protein